ncbi:hypothetical protein [Microcoleus sp.]|uniref:hypothetical protein n=2 Tax=Microcoleus sp. TaxID=44472 RepID=UPI00352473A9
MYRFEANFQSVSTDFRYETGVSTPGGLCHKADKFSVGFRAIEFERKVRSHFWVDGRSGFLWMGDRIFGWMGDRVFGWMGDRIFGWMGDRI